MDFVTSQWDGGIPPQPEEEEEDEGEEEERSHGFWGEFPSWAQEQELANLYFLVSLRSVHFPFICRKWWEESLSLFLPLCLCVSRRCVKELITTLDLMIFAGLSFENAAESHGIAVWLDFRTRTISFIDHDHHQSWSRSLLLQIIILIIIPSDRGGGCNDPLQYCVFFVWLV